MDELPGNLTGRFHVRVLRPALHDAHRLMPRTKDRAILRRHSLKLRYWPTPKPEDESGMALDLNWEWIRSLPGMKVGELRVQDTLGGNDNLRVIFFKPEKSQPLPTLWVIAVLQKRRNDFTKAQITNFKSRRKIVLNRFYDE
jgi:hypothetical protein